MLKLHLNNVYPFISANKINKLEAKVEQAKQVLINKTGLGSDFLGWLDLPDNYNKQEFSSILEAAKSIQNDSEYLVVIGIGGSYLGTKAVLSSLEDYFPNEKKTKIIFAGQTLSPSYLDELLKFLEDKSFSINVISKSGTTTEPAIAFRFLKALLIKKYGEDAYKRIYATTDPEKGALRTQAKELNYTVFDVPSNIGGRYSVLTAVGLLPLAVAGIDILALLIGAKKAKDDAYNLPFKQNPSLQYAGIRHLMDAKLKKKVEILVCYEPKLSWISEWWKQLFGESEGKDQKGLFPASLLFSTDLHSLGQYVQDGQRIMFETVLSVKKAISEISVYSEENDLDELNYLSGKTIHEVNNQALRGTILAHVDGGVPNLQIEINELNAENIGYLLYFFMFSCSVSCYLTDVNPFNQPGVENYKKNMFALLGKSGFEDLKKELEKRL